jgi:hypothetical protein
MSIRRGNKLLFTTIFAFACAFGTPEIDAQGEQIAKNNSDPVESAATPAGSTAVAPPAVDLPARTRTNLTRVGVESGQPITLSLDEAIRKALANNNSIEITRDDVRFQETAIRAILGVYDPVFSVTPTFTRNSTTGSGAATHDFNLVSGVFAVHSIRRRKLSGILQQHADGECVLAAAGQLGKSWRRWRQRHLLVASRFPIYAAAVSKYEDRQHATQSEDRASPARTD